MQMNCIKLFASTCLLVTVANGARIFSIVPMFGQSHWNVMDAVLQTLVHAGHNITVVTPFVNKEKITNYTQVSIAFFSDKYISKKKRHRYSLLLTVIPKLSCYFNLFNLKNTFTICDNTKQ